MDPILRPLKEIANSGSNLTLGGEIRHYVDSSEMDLQWAAALERFRSAWAEADRAFAAAEHLETFDRASALSRSVRPLNRGTHRLVGGTGLYEILRDDDRIRWGQSHYFRFLACLRTNGALYGRFSWLCACDAALEYVWALSKPN